MSKLSRCLPAKCGASLLDRLEHRVYMVSQLDCLNRDGVHGIESFRCELLALPHMLLLRSVLAVCLVKYLRRKRVTI